VNVEGGFDVKVASFARADVDLRGLGRCKSFMYLFFTALVGLDLFFYLYLGSG
jgi:hypothetical protein